MAGRERVVGFAVKARDEFSNVLKNLEKQQERLSAASRATARHNLNNRAKAEIQAEIEHYKRLTADIERYREAQTRAARTGSLSAAEMRELGDSIRLVRTRSQEAITALQQKRAALNSITGSTRSGFAAFDRMAVAMQKSGKAAADAAARDAQLAAAEERSNAVALRKEQIRQRLNNVVQSGYAHWNRYVETVNRIRAAEERSAAATALKERIQARLNNGVQSGYGAFIRAAEGITREGGAASATSAQLNKLDTAVRKAAATQNTLRTATDAATNSLRRQQSTQGRGNQQEIEVWGLRPWQLTNLGYQINDVVSGLAMGQAPMQVFAQQAGQFAQIWPNVMVSLARSIPIIAGVTAVLAPFLIAGNRIRQQAESMRQFSAELALSADGARYSAEQLSEAAEKITEFGVRMKDARDIVKSFVREGLNADQIEPLARMAQQLSNISGNSVTEEADRISKAFAGTVEDVRELDRELNFLTASQLQQIRSMKEGGDAAGAMALAQSILAGKLAETVTETNDWGEALKDLKTAWDDLVSVIQDSFVMDAVIKLMQLSATQVRGYTLAVKNLSRALTGGNVDQTIGAELLRLEQQLADIRERLDTERALSVNGSGDLIIDRLEEEKRVTESLIATLKDKQKATEAAAAAQSQSTELSEDEQKNLLDVQVMLDKQLETLREEARLVELTNRERFIEEELLKAKNKALEEAKKTGQDILGLTKEQTEAIRQQAGATFDARKYSGFLNDGDTGNFVSRVVGAESGGNRFAKNSLSSATGLGQFIESTWLEMFERYFPDRAANMSREVILALRTDAQTSRQMIELYARENAKILQSAGLAVNDASLYLAHFLGPNGAVKVLSAAGDTVVSDILKADQIAANQSVLGGGKTAEQVITWAREKMSLTESEVELNTRLVESQQQYLADFQQRTTAQQYELDLARKTAREAAIAKAIREEELKAKEAGVTLSAEELATVERLAAAEFDRANANAEIDRLMARRATLLETMELAQASGDQNQVQAIRSEILGIHEQLDQAITSAIEFWKAIGGPGADEAINKLEQLRASLGNAILDMEKNYLPTAEDLNERLSEIGANAFDAFAQALANGENAVQAFFAALQQGIAEFLIEIGKAIIQQAIFNALTQGGGSGGGFGGWLSGILGSIFHEGGIVGGAAPSRMVNPAVFAGAQRYHTGGIVGLKPNEVPIIAMEGEEVLTAGDPRHSRNGGGAVNVKNVNVFNPVDVFEQALQTVEGERVLLNFMTRNAQKVGVAING